MKPKLRLSNLRWPSLAACCAARHPRQGRMPALDPGRIARYPVSVGSEEFINLEVYLNARGNGLPIETPGIRR